jgi:hypothetical protein
MTDCLPISFHSFPLSFYEYPTSSHACINQYFQDEHTNMYAMIIAYRNCIHAWNDAVAARDKRVRMHERGCDFVKVQEPAVRQCPLRKPYENSKKHYQNMVAFMNQLCFFGEGDMSGMGKDGVGAIPGGMEVSKRTIEERYDVIPNGTVVSFKDLVLPASSRTGVPGMKVGRGQVRGYDAHSGLYTVIVDDDDDDDDDTKLTLTGVKPSNLLQHVRVRVRLASRPDVNGLSGIITAWNEDEQHYDVDVITDLSNDIQVSLKLKPTSIVMDYGTVGMITGMMGRQSELNGTYGTIIKSESSAGIRGYNIQLSASQCISVDVEHFLV